VSFFGEWLLITPFVSSNSYCISFFGVWTLITPFVSSQGPYIEGQKRRVSSYKRSIQGLYTDEGQTIIV
jgi:hypothetical protein